ncbi:MAG: enoyl-CoA hydratase [Deltaproteobacteria bacterium]|nr:enoyl-CoA hydratase [Deltaproteobacteria bacterium]
MTESVLLSERDAGMVTLTLNRPHAMNALSHELRQAIVQTFHELQADADVRVVILTGAGKAFCAGLDLKELGQTGLPAVGARGAVGGDNDIIQAMAQFDRPIIGAINGVAITGGFELALACDILVASSAARFADTHARVGAMPGWGLSQKLSRLIGIYRAKELSLTGNFLLAEKAGAWGLVNRVVAPEDLLPTCRQLAMDILSCVPEMVRNLKRVIDDGYAQTFSEGMQIEYEAWRSHSRTLNPEEFAARRVAVQQRGRNQTS